MTEDVDTLWRLSQTEYPEMLSKDELIDLVQYLRVQLDEMYDTLIEINLGGSHGG